MSFYTSLSGLKASQSDLSAISNNVANAGSTGFKKSRAVFGDVFAASPNQASNKIAGSGTRLVAIQQQFSQGTLESTDKTLDLAIAGDGFFPVKSQPPREQLTFTRNGAFAVNANREVVDTIGSKLQVLPVDAEGKPTATDLASMTDLVLPVDDGLTPASPLASVAIDNFGLVTATFSNGTTQKLGAVGLATFANAEGLRPAGDAHWQISGASGDATVGAAGDGAFGTIRSGSLERANVDITEELVSLISAQRNFQANAKAIETSNMMTQAITNLRS